MLNWLGTGEDGHGKDQLGRRDGMKGESVGKDGWRGRDALDHGWALGTWQSSISSVMLSTVGKIAIWRLV